MSKERLIVFGPTTMIILVGVFLAGAVALAFFDMKEAAGMIVIAVVSRALPLAKGRSANPKLGRKEDVIAFVTRHKEPPILPPPTNGS